ncbi:hypothetical protein HKX48_009403 [Thoreauomyces humboldtii]|nr:hypothetical protein HKX48_009403 [Thoreauomyces humboldtii]
MISTDPPLPPPPSLPQPQQQGDSSATQPPPSLSRASASKVSNAGGLAGSRSKSQSRSTGFLNPAQAATAINALGAPPPLPRPPPKEPLPTPNRHDRRLQFGIDCAEMVHFTHWEPGGEHVKQLIVKNVVMKTQKIKYRLPQTRYFSMEFPETITLSAGMNWTIPVTFRPVAKENYHDVIEFTTSFGKFYVPVKATLPEHVLEFPDAIDFQLCPTRETARETFVLRNVGELASSYEWTIPKPFSIAPKSGHLMPGCECPVTIDFKPANASVFNATAVCTFGDRKQWDRSKAALSMNVFGIGKYSFLAIEGGNHNFDFGEVFVGKSLEKRFVLQNHSAVPANFRIQQPEGDPDPYFEFSALSGTVPSGKSTVITITYAPAAAGILSTDYFDITTISGNTVRIVCTGHGAGPRVTLNTSVVNFNDVQATTTVTRALFVQNHSSTVAFYQFLVEPLSVFRIDKPSGNIGPNSSVALTVKFSAVEPINYYRRVYCLVEHQDALTLDMVGTCYNDKRRPATFLLKQIDNYRDRKRNGLWAYGPEQLEEMIKTGTITCNDGLLQWANQAQKDLHRSKSIRDSSYPECAVGSEFFYENTGDSEPVTLVDTYVDFGSCSRYRVIESQCIRVSNNTKGKMSCVWIMPGELAGQPSAFSVSPAVSDILPRSTVDFRVSFRPNVDNSIYGVQLECFVYFKSMRNFRLVNQETFTPPWCLTPLVTGNTFTPGEDSFIPKIDFGGQRLDFPACHVDRSVYRTIRVSNTGDTPVQFAVLDGAGVLGQGGGTPMASAGGAAFTVKPRVGVLHRNESRLLVFRFSPSEQRIFEQTLKCAFNSSASNTHEFHMKGVGYFPHINFGTDNTVCFKPTCVGSVAKRSFTARNTSKITVNFQWRIPRQYATIVSIEPTGGKMLPNSSMDFVCTFAPNGPRNWIIKLPCSYSHVAKDQNVAYDLNSSPDTTSRRATLSVIGQGAYGRIDAKPQRLDVSAVLVNSITERELILSNPTACDVFYQLEITRRRIRNEEDAGEDGQERSHEEEDEEVVVPNDVRESGVEIMQRSIDLPARSHQALRVRVCLTEQVQHEYRVYYRLEPHAQCPIRTGICEEETSERQYLCDISALGVHPLIQVSDIRCEGFSKTNLWQLFSLERFNSLLTAVDPSPTDGEGVLGAGPHPDEANCFPTDPAAYAISYDTSGHASPVTFDFGGTPVGCRPTVYHLNLRNSGVVPVEWVYYFPNDLEIEIERWADPGDYTEEQIHHNFITDNGLFLIHPKRGWLDPGESVHVTMTYSHDHAGHHKLPVVFKLKNGTTQSSKEIILHFDGSSLPPDVKCLHFQGTVHDFNPVEIGTVDPPVQTYQLMNRGATQLEYTMDLSLLKDVKHANHDVDIFDCQQTSGVIAPGAIENIKWVFNPFECKQYEVDIPITVTDGPTQIITFRGEGVENIMHTQPSQSNSYRDPIPAVQELVIPEQIATLSKERINFGHVPLGVTVRDLIVVTNTNSDSDVSFKWLIPDDLERSLKIQPASGLLQPLESRVCKVAFSPLVRPEMYLVDIACEIMDETQLGAYNTARDVIETARREGRPLSVMEPIQQRRDSVRPGGGPPSAHDLSKVKYRTLPPIPGNKAVAAAPTGKKGDDREKERERDARPSSSLSVCSESSLLSGLPAAPQPLHLFLALVARSRSIEECRALYSGYDGFFHERRTEHQIVPLDHSAFTSSSTHEMIASALSSILDDVFQDPDVQDLPDKLRTDPLPYYAQIATSRPVNGIDLWNETEATAAPEGRELEEDDQIVTDVLGILEFHNLLETVLEGTLYNLMQEANLDEFDMTKTQMKVLQA